MIIETGFMAYFLLREFQDIEGDIIIDEFKKRYLNRKTWKKGWISNSLVFRTISFVYHFVKLIVISIQEFASSIRKNYKKKHNINQHLNLPRQDNNESESINLEHNIQIEEARLDSNIELPTLDDALGFFFHHSGSVEIQNCDIISTIYFMKQPYCIGIPSSMKSSFHRNADRSSLKSKLIYLVQTSTSLIDRLKSEMRFSVIFQANPFLKLLSMHKDLWIDLSITSACVINIYLMIASSKSEELESDRLTYLSGLMLGFYLIEMITYYSKTIPYILSRSLRNKGGRHLHYSTLEGFRVKLIYIFKEEYQLVYSFLFVTFAICGIIFHKFFLSFHVTALYFRYEEIQNVVKAGVLSLKQLGLTFFFWNILQFTFSVGSFSFFNRLIWIPDSLSDLCGNSLFECFILHWEVNFMVGSK